MEKIGQAYRRILSENKNLQQALEQSQFQLQHTKAVLKQITQTRNESKTRGYEDTPEKIARFEREAQFMPDRRGSSIEQDYCISPAFLASPKHQQQISSDFTVVVPWWDHTDLLKLWEHNIKALQQAEVIFIDNGSVEEGKKSTRRFLSKILC